MLEKIAKFMNCHKGKSMYIRGYDVQVYGLSTTPTMNVHEGSRVIFQIRYSNGKYWLFYAKEDQARTKERTNCSSGRYRYTRPRKACCPACPIGS